MFTFRGRRPGSPSWEERYFDKPPRFASGGYCFPPGFTDGQKDRSRAMRAWGEFHSRFCKKRGLTIVNAYGGVIASLVRSAFYAGWHASKRATLAEGYGAPLPKPTTSDQRVAEYVLRTILAEGPVAVAKVREHAERAGVAWPAIIRAASRIAQPWRWPCVSVTHWELRDPENDFESFLDAGIPNG